MIGIYKIRNIKNDKYYIGSSIDIQDRWYQHKNSLSNNKHHSIKLQRSYNIYGENNFIYDIIEECDKNLLIAREQYYIDTYNSYKNGYNSTKFAGSNLGMKHSIETKEILRQKSLGNQNMLNKKHTEETKEKIKLKLKGRIVSEITKQKMKISSQNRKEMSIETRTKISVSKKGKKLSDENKNKISMSHLGKKQSNETITKRVEKNKGQKRTEDIRQKMSENMRGIKKGQMTEENKLLRSKRIALISDNDDILKEFNGVKICATELNIDRRRIGEILSGKRKSFKNFKFKII